MNTLLADIATRYPYPGLRPFEPHEADIFFGRKKHVTDLLKRLKSQRLLVVVGPSGCGKSSLIRAGLIPSLRAGFMARSQSQWNFAVFRPGNQPLTRLAEALYESGVFGPVEDHSPEQAAENVLHTKECLEAGSRSLADRLLVNRHSQGTNLLILVDQFEELFRFEGAGGGEESRAFVNLLLETTRDPDVSAYVVLTMRTDFIGQCPVFAGLPEALNDSQYLTPRLTREQIESAIVGPARMFDSEVEPDVVNRILNEMGTDPDQLPLMQHLLMRMWRSAVERDGKSKEDSEQRLMSGRPANLELSSVRLTMQDYKDTGGLLNALGQHAQGIYDVRLTTDRQRSFAEQMFRQLTEVAPNGQFVRCSPAPTFGELRERLQASPVEMRQVIDVFRREGRSFLMPPPDVDLDDETPIDISHESLIRNWPLLNEWTRDEALADQIQTEVSQSANVFALGGHKVSDAAMPESRLAVALEWANSHPRDVSQQVRRFLDACVKTKHREKLAYRRVWIASSFALFFTIVTCLFALQQQGTYSVLSKRFWRDAVQQLNSVSQGKEDLAVALLWTAEARKEEPSLTWFRGNRRSLYDVRFHSLLSQYPQLEQVASFGGQSVKAYSPNLKYLVTFSPSKDFPSKSDMHIWDRQKPEKPLKTIENQYPAQEIKFDSSGRFLLTLDQTGTNSFGQLALWKLTIPGNVIDRMPLVDAAGMDIYAASFVPATDAEAEPAIVAITRNSTTEDSIVASSQTGLVLWSAYDKSPTSFVSPAIGGTRETPNGPKAAILAPTKLTVSYDGTTVASWGNLDPSQCGGLSLWSIAERELIVHDSQAQATVEMTVFSSSNKLLATIDREGKACLWDLAQASALTEPWPAHIGAGQKVIFSPDDQSVLTIGADNMARLWTLPTLDQANDAKPLQLKPAPVIQAAFAHDSDIYGAAFSSDSQLLATAGRDRLARIWNVESGQLAAPPLHHASGVDRVQFVGEPSSHLLTTTVSISQLWNLSPKNPPPRTLTPPDAYGTELSLRLAYSENGRYAVIANEATDGIHIDVWDSKRQTIVNSHPILHAEARSISYAAVSDDGRRLLAVVETGQSPTKQAGFLWNCENRGVNKPIKLWDDENAARCCAGFSSNAKALLIAREVVGKSGEDSGTWRLHAWSEGRPAMTDGLDVRNLGCVNHVVWNAQGDLVVVSSGKNEQTETQGAATLWRFGKVGDTLTKEQVWQHKLLQGESSSNGVLHAVFLNDGKYVASGGIDNTAYLWKIDSKEPVSPPLRHTSDIVHLAVSPDGSYLATSSVADWKTCIWDIYSVRRQSRSRLAVPKYSFTHGGTVNRAVFSHDSHWLATVSSDKQARIWSLGNGELAAQFQHTGNVRAALFSDDDCSLTTMCASLVADRQSRLPKQSWPKLYFWNLQKKEAKSYWHAPDIVGSARLLAASELDSGRSSLHMLSSGGGAPAADAEYLRLWQENKADLFPVATPSARPTGN